MIQFKQKSFTEYDAMRYLYVELCKRGDRQKWKPINKSSLLPILNGNSVVIERFVVSTSFFGKDKYRMYIKVGAKAKMPDEVRLAESKVYDKTLFGARVKVGAGTYAGKYPYNNDKKEPGSVGRPPSDNNGGGGNKKPQGGNNWKEKRESLIESGFDNCRQKLFGKGGNSGPSPFITTDLDIPYAAITYEVRELLGEAIKYDKKERSLVLEFGDVDSAIRALNILPFGIDYSIYLLT